MQPPQVLAIVLASGASLRMGGADKLLLPVDGQPMLRRVAAAFHASRCVETRVILPQGADLRHRALGELDLAVFENTDAGEGMAAAIRCGVAGPPPDTDGVIVGLGDMPDITAADVDSLITGFDPSRPRMICRAATEDGRPGNPVLFAKAHFPALARLRGDRGARDLLSANAAWVTPVPLPGRRAVTDIDTQEDWARYQARAPG